MILSYYLAFVEQHATAADVIIYLYQTSVVTKWIFVTTNLITLKTLVVALDDITVGRTFVVATLPSGLVGGGIDRFYFVSSGPGTVSVESLNYPVETFTVDAGQVRSHAP